jgi:Transcription factor Tfb2
LISSMNFSTSSAYRFVLQPRRTQLWQMILHALELVDVRLGPAELCTCIRLVCGLLQTLISSTVCLPDESGIGQFIALLQGMGIVTTQGEGLIIPAGGLSALRGEVTKDLLAGANLVVDSNLHLTGYTTNPLQLKIIGLFSELRRQLGSAVSAIITRKSILRASESGVAVSKVIEFLKSNAHKVTAGIVPPTVTTQLKLWEADAIHNRLRITPAIHVTWDRHGSEGSVQEYRRIRQLAEAAGALLASKDTEDHQVLVIDQLKAIQLNLISSS